MGVRVFAILFVFLLCSQWVKAEDVTVLVWVEDEKNIFNRENYNAAIVDFQKNGLTNIRTMYFKEETPIRGNLDKRIRAFIDVDDKVTGIIFAAHGRFKPKFNRTSLSVLGGYGPKGPYKEMTYILEKLSPYFSNKLHIYLDSCTSMCGTEDEVLKRNEGLYKWLNQYGITDLTVWGATERLYSHVRDYKDWKSKVRLSMTKQSYEILAASFAMNIFAFTTFSDYSPDRLSSDILSAVAGTAATFAAIVGTYFFMYRKNGNNGVLVNINSNGITQSKASRFDEGAVLGIHKTSACYKLF